MVFGFFKKDKGNANAQPTVNASASSSNATVSTLNLSKEEAVKTLNLRKETLGITLEKKALKNVHARVAIVMDQSGSMSNLYKNGTVQAVIERILPIGLQFDDNGELDIWLFSDKFKRLDSITENDFYQYVNREIMNKRENQIWGGTRYAPVMQDVLTKYVSEEPSTIPTFVIFVTDGENFDHSQSESVIREASNHNIFWQFVGIGDEDFKFLKKLDDLKGRKIDNANFFQIENINKISDEELYNLLLNEYPVWEKEARQIGLIQ